ncbi:MAG: hypothetical protein LBU91_09535 [Bacteroidales bacterium]|jgi:hypothetical protein|nr:hypothetical protein [Bacteroidales bacterium]
MKTLTFKLAMVSAILLMLAGVTFSCKEKEKKSELPPETQTGANTFGCYLNGELFVPRPAGQMYSKPAVAAIYYLWPGGNYLSIQSLSTVDNQIYFGVWIDESRANEYNSTNLIVNNQYLVCDDCNWKVFITKFDTINRIVSGTFEFTGQSRFFDSDVSPEQFLPADYQITDGRFDIVVYIEDRRQENDSFDIKKLFYSKQYLQTIKKQML